MSKVRWQEALNFERAAANVRSEFPGDWHLDPWSWPEIDVITKRRQELLEERLDGSGFRRPSLIDVPKENWGSRPAVVVDVLDRLAYQALVDRTSVELIGDLSPSVYGWRLAPNTRERGRYSHNNIQWDAYRGHLSAASTFDSALRSDLTSCFASIPEDLVLGVIDERLNKGAIKDRLQSLIEGFNMTPTRSGLPQRSLASAVVANMYLTPLDDALDHHAVDVPDFLILLGHEKKPARRSWLRWMDDIWLFGDDPSNMRSAQLEIQNVARSLGNEH